LYLPQLSKGVNGSTFSQYDILRNTPKHSIQQDMHSNQVWGVSVLSPFFFFSHICSSFCEYLSIDI
jgi:hypothetical protein